MSFHDECMYILISPKKLIKFSKEKDYTQKSILIFQIKNSLITKKFNLK